MDPSSPLPALDPAAGALCVVLALLGVAFFSSSEAAFLSLSPIRMRALAEGGKPAASRVLKLLQDRDRFVATITLAEKALILLAATLTAYLVAQLHIRLFHAPMDWLYVSALVALETLVVVMLFVIVPKTFAAAFPEPFALLMVTPLAFFHAFLAPLAGLIAQLPARGVASAALRYKTAAKGDAALTPTPDSELRLILDDVAEQGGLEEDESEMIRSVIGLSETAVREIMVPRIEMVTLPHDAPFEEVVRVAVTEGHSRVPIYEGSVDRIVGVLHVKDLLALLVSDMRPVGLPAELIRPAYHVPESKKLDELLSAMRLEKTHLAIVLDEFGGTAGLITIEDILEEIVGEIRDEYDAEELLPIEVLPDGSLSVEGKAPIDDVSERLGTKLPTEDFDTIGGFVVGMLGRAPVAGDEVDYEDVHLVIEEVENRRVTRVRLTREAPAKTPTGPLAAVDASPESPELEPR